MRSSDYESHILIEFLKEESGSSLIERILIASLIAVVCGLFFMALNKNI